MPRRLGLPGASELFRQTEATPDAPEASDVAGRVSGRVKHDEKITVYVSGEELLALEQARLRLRAEHGIAVDRGRIVRAALALMMDDLEARGAESDLVVQLGGS